MNQENEIKEWVQGYLKISLDYARAASGMADHLDTVGIRDARLVEELTSNARKSEQLAEKISDLMKLARDTPSDSWLPSNVVQYIEHFIELSRCYTKMRDGFIDSFTNDKSPVPRIIPEDVNTPKDQKDHIMLWMQKQKRRTDDKRQWSNTAIANLFGIKPNSVVNRLKGPKEALKAKKDKESQGN